ncbi:uncharacterized protein METZ01_LOCUS423905, partial [marine metagenome]
MTVNFVIPAQAGIQEAGEQAARVGSRVSGPNPKLT